MNTIGTWKKQRQGSSSRSGSRTRWRAATATSTARRSSTRPPASGWRCPFVYAYEAWGHTYVGCMQKIYDVEIDLELLEEAEAGRSGFGAVRARRAPLPMCEVEVVGTYPHREDELGCRMPEFHELPRERATFRVFATVAD